MREATVSHDTHSHQYVPPDISSVTGESELSPFEADGDALGSAPLHAWRVVSLHCSSDFFSHVA